VDINGRCCFSQNAGAKGIAVAAFPTGDNGGGRLDILPAVHGRRFAVHRQRHISRPQQFLATGRGALQSFPNPLPLRAFLKIVIPGPALSACGYYSAASLKSAFGSGNAPGSSGSSGGGGCVAAACLIGLGGGLTGAALPVSFFGTDSTVNRNPLVG